MTYLPVAKYNSDRLGSSATVNGNRLPYAPELVANLALNYQTGALTTRLSATHVSSQFVDAANTVSESDDGRSPKYSDGAISSDDDDERRLSDSQKRKLAKKFNKSPPGHLDSDVDEDMGNRGRKRSQSFSDDTD